MSGSNSSTLGSDRSDAPEQVSPLSFTVHSMPTPDLSARRTAAGRLKMLAVLAICSAPVIAAYIIYFVIGLEGRTTNYSEFVTPTREMPEALPLRNLAGQPVLASSLRGQWLIVVVADGACDAGCESHLLLQRQVQEMLGNDKPRVDKVWLIPGEAAPRAELLKAIAPGRASHVLQVPAEALSQWLKPSDGHRLDEHVYLVDPKGQWMMRTPVDPEPVKLKKDLERLLRASASWDQPGR
jgi:cytochrome oxidase Cu insertion factor (SCO1/SenC/PrrC family)